jgi:pimeloyl-ACP methyl ester carboxylesterase
MIACHYKAPGVGSDLLIVMLPGAGIEAAEFAGHGMVAAVHAHGLAADIVAAQPDLELYLDGGIAAALANAIVEPARAQGYTRIWLLGISLGGMGALLYASEHATLLEGLILLAPFLGTQGTIAGMAAVGGLKSWSAAASAATDAEKAMLVWLQNYVVKQPSAPLLYLGYGREDRFAPGHLILAEELPDNRVVSAEGGHDWTTWLTLWRGVLDAAPFDAAVPGAYDDGMQEHG